MFENIWNTWSNKYKMKNNFRWIYSYFCYFTSSNLEIIYLWVIFIIIFFQNSSTFIINFKSMSHFLGILILLIRKLSALMTLKIPQKRVTSSNSEEFINLFYIFFKLKEKSFKILQFLKWWQEVWMIDTNNGKNSNSSKATT